MTLVYFSGAYRYLSFEMLKSKYHLIRLFVEQHPIATPLIFIGIYIISTALSLPVGAFLSILGGFLFPQPLSTIYVVFGATLGACLLFIAAKTALGDALRKKSGSLLYKMKKGFQENAASYLLFLRLVPIFPFWLVNLAPAFFGVSFKTFFWATAVGIIPASFVFTQAGIGLGAILETQGQISLDTVFNLQVKIALISLGIFALIPIVIKKLKKNDR